jgi:hypothetical protein
MSGVETAPPPTEPRRERSARSRSPARGQRTTGSRSRSRSRSPERQTRRRRSWVEQDLKKYSNSDLLSHVSISCIGPSPETAYQKHAKLAPANVKDVVIGVPPMTLPDLPVDVNAPPKGFLCPCRAGRCRTLPSAIEIAAACGTHSGILKRVVIEGWPSFCPAFREGQIELRNCDLDTVIGSADLSHDAKRQEIVMDVVAEDIVETVSVVFRTKHAVYTSDTEIGIDTVNDPCEKFRFCRPKARFSSSLNGVVHSVAITNLPTEIRGCGAVAFRFCTEPSPDRAKVPMSVDQVDTLNALQQQQQQPPKSEKDGANSGGRSADPWRWIDVPKPTEWSISPPPEGPTPDGEFWTTEPHRTGQDTYIICHPQIANFQSVQVLWDPRPDSNFSLPSFATVFVSIG